MLILEKKQDVRQLKKLIPLVSKHSKSEEHKKTKEVQQSKTKKQCDLCDRKVLGEKVRTL